MTNMGSSNQTAIVQSIALLSHYAFDTKGLTPAELISQWLERYEATWIRQGVIEALYQGRYKAISVEHILSIWIRRGQATPHFTSDFERIISRKLPDYFALENPPTVEGLPKLDEKRHKWRMTLEQSKIFSANFVGTAYEKATDQEKPPQREIAPWHSDRAPIPPKIKTLTQLTPLTPEDLNPHSIPASEPPPDLGRILAILSGETPPPPSPIAPLTPENRNSASPSPSEPKQPEDIKPESPSEPIPEFTLTVSHSIVEEVANPLETEKHKPATPTKPPVTVLEEQKNEEQKNEEQKNFIDNRKTGKRKPKPHSKHPTATAMRSPKPMKKGELADQSPVDSTAKKNQKKPTTPTLPNTYIPNPYFYRSTIRVFTPTAKPSYFFRRLTELNQTPKPQKSIPLGD